LRRVAAAAVALAVLAALAVGASAKLDRSQARLTVFAASSLTDAFPAIDRAPRYSFAGSNALATQIRNGAPADVFASANASLPAQLHAQGYVERPVVFTRNALVVVVPRSNPARIRTVADLTRPGVKVDVANPSVPVGGYTQQVLAKLKLAARIRPNVVSEETDVREVLAKIALGQADAGFVYATDAASVARKVKTIRLPARAQPNVTYALAVVSRSRNKPEARAFVRRILGKAGQARLRSHGFLPLAQKR
jgi:molybdate transport system substrate-binding protein